MDAEETPDSPPTKPRRRWLRRLVRLSLIVAVLALVVAGVGAGVLGYLYQKHVVEDPGPQLERAHIMSIIAQESPVYYRDGTTRVGVFFDDEHRQFVAFDELPPAYVAAIVASEDGAFWSHRGVHPKHIARAMVDNIQAGRTVSGGSTLTQQTAKNLYYRPDRSWRSKSQELVNALRLEAHYDKSEILTFYVNQFHVSGNGRGLGIAARYFFDEDVADLRQRSTDENAGADLVKSAFLAGLVKGPGRYDPFLGDPDRQQRSRERAMARTRYVLQRIVDEPAENLVGPWPVDGGGDAHAARLRQVNGWKAEAQRLLDEGFELPFRRGRFRYDSNAVLDEVRRRLSAEPFAEVLDAAGIEDPDKAGLVVVTTLDPDAQREAIYGLWHHLTEVGSWMEGLTAADFIRSDSSGPRHDPFHTPRPHEFRLGTVVGHPIVGKRMTMDLDLGGHPCTVDRDGLVRAALAVERGEQKNRYAKVPGAKVDAFATAVTAGSVVWVSVREVSPDGAVCDLEVRPELQGSTVVLEDGQIRAMVGGNDNRNFNRATALRQFGSTWKPLVYHAAIELGWRPDAPLDNRHNVFPFSTTFYYPRPDHTPEPVVSMAWAGVNSENLASIWLLYHLTDRLDPEQVRSLAEGLDLARRPGEDAKAYRTRIQKAGVLPTRARVREALFLRARRDVLAALPRTGHPEDELALSSLLYGWGHTGERAKVATRGGRSRATRELALANSFRHLESLAPTCERQYRSLVSAVDRGVAPEPAIVSDLWVMVDEDRVRVACGAPPTGFVRPDGEGLAAILPAARDLLPGSTPGPMRRRGLGQRITDLFSGGAPSPVAVGPKLVPWSDVVLDERLHVGTFEEVAAALARREAVVAASDMDLYDPELLYWHQDFRVLLSLRYVSRLAGQYGVRSDIKPVLSIPLGASEITLEEATAVYGGLVTGERWSFPGRASTPGAVLAGTQVASPPDPALLIAEIRDVDGRVIYKAAPQSRAVAGAQTGAMSADILRNVVQHGTGRRASSAVRVDGQIVPVGGKTGTTNDFKNAAFIGVVPRWEGGRWDPAAGYVIGTYVGYDDNRPMSRGRTRLAGASGALPAWILAAQGLAGAELLGEPDPIPEGGRPEPTPSGLERVAVDEVQGLPLTVPADPASAHHVLVPTRPVFSLRDLRFDDVPRPARVAPSTSEAAERARLRRDMLEQLRDRPSLWDDEVRRP